MINITINGKDTEEIKRIGILVSGKTKNKWEKFVESTKLTTISNLIRKSVNFYIDSQDKIAYIENFSKLSHDLKEPLTSIKGFSQLILENYSEKMDSKILNFMHKIYAQSVFLENKINEFLTGMEPESSQYDILIVEDDTSTSLVLTDFLEIKGYSSLGVTTGNRAIEELNRSIPKLVLLDIMLPDISGYDICKKMKDDENLKNVPVYYITAIPEAEVSKKIAETGANGFILKPFDFSDFDMLFNLLN